MYSVRHEVLELLPYLRKGQYHRMTADHMPLKRTGTVRCVQRTIPSSFSFPSYRPAKTSAQYIRSWRNVQIKNINCALSSSQHSQRIPVKPELPPSKTKYLDKRLFLKILNVGIFSTSFNSVIDTTCTIYLSVQSITTQQH